MNPIKKELRLPKYEYYEKHLSIVNSMLPIKMTEMEIKVLSRFMALEGDIAVHRFGPTARKVVKESLGITTAGLSNYLGEGKGSLIEKGFLKKTGDVIDIQSILIPEKDEQIYSFKLVNLG